MISYCITVYNEIEYITKLLDKLSSILQNDEEIVVVQTYRVNEEQNSEIFLKTKKLIHQYNVTYNTCHFDMSYGVFNKIKNYANSLATKPYIFNLDADEDFPEQAFPIIRQILANNPNLDLIYVPRLNIVDGLTKEDVKKWHWQVNDNGWINWPDFQPRIYKNNKILKWVGGPHNTIIGSQKTAALEANPDLAIIHNKNIHKQREQNAFYDDLENKEKLYANI